MTFWTILNVDLKNQNEIFFTNLPIEFFVCFSKFTTPGLAMNNLNKYFFLCLSFLLLPFLSLYSQTGPNNPAAITNDASNGGVVAWTTPENASASDNFYANATGLSMGQPTQFIKATDFGFAINPCDDIVGIEVKIEWAQTGTVLENAMHLVVNDAVQTTVNKSTGATLPLTDGVTIFGGPADPWGQTLKGADVNKPGFGMAASLVKTGGATGNATIDHITITIYHTSVPAMSYSSGTVSQITTLVNPNSENNPVIRVDVAMNNGCPFVNASSFTFNMNGTTSLTDVDNAKLFYTGTDPVFNSSNQLGSAVTPISAGNFTISGFTQPLQSGTNYFWLTADVVIGATINNVVDGECPSLIIDGISRTPSGTAPAGNRTITAPNTYSVGATQTYFTIQAAYDAIPVNPVNQSIIEIYSDYNPASETFPITFGNKSNAFDIIVRPHSTATGIVCTGSLGSNGIWVMDNAQKIIVDGRPGGSGTAREFTVKNTKAASPYGTAFVIKNDSRNITFQHLIIEAETTSGTGLDGIISIGTTTGTSGNDYISVLNCHLRDLTAGSAVSPFTGVYSSGTIAKSNDFITVNNCEFSDGGLPAVNIYSNSSNAIITNNQVYYSGATAIGGVIAQFINVTSGSDHKISGNFLGGSAPNCGGTQFYISSGTANVTGINVDAGGNNFIESNTIGNIRYTTTYNLASYPLIGIRVAGTGNYTVGSSGKGNLIGSISGTANFRLTHNGSSGEGVAGIINNSTGTVTIAYNNIGAVTQDGTFAGADAIMILTNTASGSVTIDNNIIGSSSAGDNILMSSNSNFYGISNTGSSGMTCTNNTVKYVNYMVLSATLMYGISNTAGTLTCSGNTLKNLTSNNLQYIINHSGTTATISSNLIQDISETAIASTASFYGIYINTASAVACSLNTIGGITANNISLSSNALSAGIWNNSTGTLTASDNIIRNVLANNGGTTTQFIGIFNVNGGLNITNNTLSDISVSSTRVGGSGIAGIATQSTAASQVIENNNIKSLYQTNTSAASTSAVGILCSSGNGSVKKNMISDITDAATDNTAELRGIEVSAGPWDIFNNVVLINNGSNTNDLIVRGIVSRATGTASIYHNSVKIYGSVTAGSAATASFYRSNTGTNNVKNNIFQNIRMGGTGGHFAEHASSTAAYTTDYNFLEVQENPSNIGNWGGTAYDFNNWQINSLAANDLNGSVTLDANGRITTCFTGANKGTNLIGTVNDDKDATARDATPCIGAFETNSSPWDYYWVGGNGSWADLTHWSCSSGGTGGVSIPTINDNVYIDNSSGTVTISIPSGTWYTKGFTMSGAGVKSQIIGPGALLPRP